ncbi:MAG: secretin N-terminal domain-containing protein [Candidatus Babeliales bacterium]
MMNIRAFFLFLLATILCSPFVTYSDEQEKLLLHLNRRPFKELITLLAEKKGFNVIFSHDDPALNTTIQLSLNQEISIDNAWGLLLTLLDITGYTLIQKGSPQTFYLEEINPNTTRNILPLYINSSQEELPDTDEIIRFLYFFSTLKINNSPTNDPQTIIKELLPKETTFVFNADSNSILISGKARAIKHVVQLFTLLDSESEKKDVYEIIPLQYTAASTITKLFTDEIFKAHKKLNTYKVGDSASQALAMYFSNNVRIIPEERSNRIIVLGDAQDVTRIKDFIVQYIDIPVTSDHSILHIKQLQYLDASKLAPVLTQIVQSKTSSGGNLSQSQGKNVQSSTTRYFQGVIIKSDKPAEQNKFPGGNKLIVAANPDDWEVLERLINEIDKPSPQVIIEMLFANLTLEETRLLGGAFRKPLNLSIKDNVGFQTAPLAPSSEIILDSSQNPTTLNADLLGNVFPTGQADPTGNVANALTSGTTLLSISDATDGKTWGLLQIANQLDNVKVLSHPHIIGISNKAIQIIFGEQQFLPGEAVASASATTQKRDIIDANLKIEITPRISASALENETNLDDILVNLQIKINVTEFTGGTTGERLTRDIVTNATVKSNDVLAIGGLANLAEQHDLSRTPLLGKLPIIGTFFKKRNKSERNSFLSVFISVIVIGPQLRAGVGKHTQNYVDIVTDYAQEGDLFGGLRDPITKIFFYNKEGAKPDAYDVITSFMEQDEEHQNIIDSHLIKEHYSEQNESNTTASPRVQAPVENLQQTDSINDTVLS